MTDQTAFDETCPVLYAKNFSKIKKPDMPVSAAIAEGEVCHALASEDLERMTDVGFDKGVLVELDKAIRTLRVADAQHFVHQGEKREAAKLCREESLKALALRRFLISSLDYALESEKSGLEKLRHLRKYRGGVAGLIQNMRNLAALGREYREQLSEINFRTEKLEECIRLADQLGAFAADAFVSDRPNERKILRDMAFTHMRELMARIRKCAKYVLYDNPERLKRYTSAYRREHYRKPREVPVPEVETSVSVNQATVSRPAVYRPVRRQLIKTGGEGNSSHGSSQSGYSSKSAPRSD